MYLLWNFSAHVVGLLFISGVHHAQPSLSATVKHYTEFACGGGCVNANSFKGCI